MADTSVAPRRRRTHEVGDWLDLSSIELTERPPRPRSDRQPTPIAAQVRQDAPFSQAAPERRTVTITGRGAERDLHATPRRRPSTPRHERPGFQPDRIALWAVLLGVFLVLVAATSSHAAVRAIPRPAAPHAMIVRHVP